MMRSCVKRQNKPKMSVSFNSLYSFRINVEPLQNVITLLVSGDNCGCN